MKRAAAAAAAAEVSSGMLLGLGTGSTASYALEGIAERLRWGEIEHVIGVPTSEATAARARSLGIPLTTLEQHPRLDLAIDGADEVDGDLRMIKGGGGALLREKIVAWSAARRVIVVDEGKRVEILGRGFPLPVEVLPFGWSTHESAFRDLGGEPQLRTGVAGSPYLTDNGNYVIDCRFPEGIDDPNRLHRQLIERPGIVETGIFAGEADALFVGREAGGVEIVTREGK
jgi:ribose 5-phosphate isomerase A